MPLPATIFFMMLASIPFTAAACSHTSKPESAHFPDDKAECREFAALNAKNSEHGTFLLSQCLAHFVETARPPEAEVVTLSRLDVDAVDGRASIRDGRFAAVIYNGSGYHLSELIIKIQLFKSEEQRARYNEIHKDIAVKPDESRSIRFIAHHPNLSVQHYDTDLDTRFQYFVWMPVGGRGTRDPGWTTWRERFREKLSKIPRPPSEPSDQQGAAGNVK